MENTVSNFDLEQKILVCLTVKHKDAHINDLVFLKVMPEYFQKPIHRELYRTILDFHHQGKEYSVIDLIGHYRLDDDMCVLLNSYVGLTSEDIFTLYEPDIERLINSYTLSKKTNDSKILLNKVNSISDETEALLEFSSGLADIAGFQVNQKSGMISVQEAIDTMLSRPRDNTIIPTNIPTLNAQLNGGFKAGSLASFIAQPRMGKTFFSIYLMDSILQANEGTQGLFYSLEMPYEQILERHAALKANRIYDCLDEEQKINAYTQMMLMNYNLCDTFTSSKSTNLEYICNNARIEHSKKPVSVIVIDYMTKIDTTKRFDRDDLKYKYIASELANLAVELRCVIINLLHSNRGSSERPISDRCPQLTDEVQSQGAGTSSGYFFGIDRPELHSDDNDWKTKSKNLFVLACRKSRFCQEFSLVTKFNAGLFGDHFLPYSPSDLPAPTKSNKKSPDEFGL